MAADDLLLQWRNGDREQSAFPQLAVQFSQEEVDVELMLQHVRYPDAVESVVEAMLQVIGLHRILDTRVDVDCRDLFARRAEQACVPACAATNVEHGLKGIVAEELFQRFLR